MTAVATFSWGGESSVDATDGLVVDNIIVMAVVVEVSNCVIHMTDTEVLPN